MPDLTTMLYTEPLQKFWCKYDIFQKARRAIRGGGSLAGILK